MSQGGRFAPQARSGGVGPIGVSSRMREADARQARREREADAFARFGPTRHLASPFALPARDAQQPRRAGGRALPAGLSERLAQSLGIDAQAIRIHDGGEAAAMADDIGAEAFTDGADMVFARGRYQPGTTKGRALIAHEALHVAQAQTGGVPPGAIQMQEGEGAARGLGASPPKAAFELGEGKAPEDTHLLFDRDQARLGAADRSQLQRIAETQDKPVRVVVFGYASQEGDRDYNLNLSAHRAVAVADYLRPRLPAGSEVTPHAHGETDAFGGVKQNRRAGIDVEPMPQPPPGWLSLTMPTMRPRYGFDLDLDLDLDFDLRAKTNIFSAEGGDVTGPDDASLADRLRRPLPSLYPTEEDLDFSSIGASGGLRGVPMTGAWGESVAETYVRQTRLMIDAGIDPEIAKLYWQMALENAVERQMMLEHPTKWDELKLQEERTGTAPTILEYDLLKLLRK